ncbi:hypothetical protein J7T55_011243 [Diaporthe amygdali]|uniref:uncharacterized protein n=1 Tax=Phomopsis amygdali TaxID=1214568 RepID=UPI0022FED125|nr:uncharacterized protein J7T55_011243 [Diaporthe amygdali]KAJ0108752.1 hypothetical protein J7T55_011243 [Diaporthe amygdali]
MSTNTQPQTNSHATKPSPGIYAKEFRKNWQVASADNDLTLYGFRRFKTSHLLNLRFLEDEIAKVDHVIYQAGLSLGRDHAPANKLGLNYCRKDPHVPDISATITEELVLKLRGLLRQYGSKPAYEALSAFNNIMTMERCSLLDDEKAASARTDLTLPEMYETRLLRPDLPPRSRADPVSHWIHRLLRDFRYWKLSRRCGTSGVEAQLALGRAGRFSHQNSAPIANFLGRLIATLMTCLFLVVPLAILSPKSPPNMQLAVVAVCILMFSFLVAAMMKASNFEMMAVSSAYAAVLAVFVSSTS